MAFSLSDSAKYPFVPYASNLVKELGLKIENLPNPELEPIVERAKNRIEEALSKNPPEVSFKERQDDLEISSFPVAVILVAATESKLIKRRYALAEARRAYNLLRDESEEKIEKIATTFKWEMQRAHSDFSNFEFAINFKDFLRNTERFQEKEWKLVNHPLLDGMVYLTKREVARLLQEEIRTHIERKLDVDVRPMLPESIIEQVEILKEKYADMAVEKSEFSSLPKTVTIESFPPCVQRLYNTAKAGGHLSHIGRFTLTSFLLRAGMETEKVMELFRSSSDFNERLTRYQIEHIAGGKGSRTEYLPPRCETLRTHGVCPGSDDYCLGIRHPLGYYLRKSVSMKKEPSKR